MLTIDGSRGEGGGQILRSSLTLSLLTGQPVCVERIREGRQKPGLARQHLTALRAASRISGAQVEGDALGSQEVRFAPGRLRGGEVTLSTDGAGSTTLVLQTVLLPLLSADVPSRLNLEGGTHNPFSPPFGFLSRAFTPLLRSMGAEVEITLERPGFYPAGGGRIHADIYPSVLQRLVLLERGPERQRSARALVSGLPRHIGERELATLQELLGIPTEALALTQVDDPVGPGNAVVITLEYEHVTEVFTGFGERGVRAETVARRAASQAQTYIGAEVPVGQHLADQLLLPLAVAGGGRFRTLPPSSHTRTNAEVIQRFGVASVKMEELGESCWEVTVETPRQGPPPSSRPSTSSSM